MVFAKKNNITLTENDMQKKIDNLEAFIANPINASVIKEFGYAERLQAAKDTLAYYQSEEYLASLRGTIGASAL